MSETIEEILFDTLDMGEDAFAPMADQLKLADRFAKHEDIPGVLATLETLFDDEAFRVRRVCYLTLKNLGQTGFEADPDYYERYTLAGLKDASPYVRHDAAWLAGTIGRPGSAIERGLDEMVAGLGDPEPNSFEDKALTRGRQALADIKARAT